MTNRRKIWITRTEPGTHRSAEAWRDAGFDPIIAPVLRTQAVTHDTLIDPSAISVFTSANAFEFLPETYPKGPAYCVGDATARAARRAGFRNVHSADGAWEDLVEIIPDSDQPIIHFRGRHKRGRVVETLRNRGLKADERIIYEAVAAWPDPVSVAKCEAVALYSPRGAERLSLLLPRGHNLTLYCLSEAIAQACSGGRVSVAEAPNETALIACALRDSV